MARQQLDVVVVGAGSSGGVVASRLSDDERCSVCLLEAGPDFPDEADSPPAFVVGGNLITENFAGAGAPTPDLDWGYESEPLENGRRVWLRRGRLVGGTSMINGCIAVRGRPADFERWVELGARGWSWEDVLPLYERVEREVPIKRYGRASWQPVQETFAAGFEELGYRRADDLNAADAWDGVVGPWPQSRRNEIRQGTLVTYLRRARGRPNLEIRDRCQVDRVLVEHGRAVGVRYLRRSRVEELRADTVVLCAGAYGSAPILLRSGIGPADELRAAGIEAVEDLPVGRRLLEHPQTLFYLRGEPRLADMAGPGLAVAARGEDFWSFPLALDEESGLCALAFGLVSWDDGGSIRLASTDPLAPPRIDHGYQRVVDGGGFDGAWRTFGELLATAAFRAVGAASAEGRAGLRELLLERAATAFHPAGGCAIGPVVDEELHVHGVEGLRVADASVFPAHVSNNPNLTCLMVGEAAAARIASRSPVAAEACG